jgi:membrane protease YdiL (CAAX protease family)
METASIPPDRTTPVGPSQLVAFFVLAYAISWGGILIVLGAQGFSLAAIGQGEKELILVAMLLGPSASGLAVTRYFEGSAGLAELKRRIMLWRVDPRWYAIALLTTPALLLPILWMLGWAVNPAFQPQLRLPLFAIGLLAGCFEELGWTGYATPRMLASHGVFRTGLTLGLLWALWHLLADASGNLAAMGWVWPAWFAIFWVATLVPYRILMTWVYARTGSVLTGMLMHAGYTGWLFVLSPETSVGQGLIWQAAFAFGLWLATLAVANATRETR